MSHHEVLSTQEIEALVGHYMKAHPDASDGELMAFLNWATEKRVGEALLRFCIDGTWIASFDHEQGALTFAPADEPR